MCSIEKGILKLAGLKLADLNFLKNKLRHRCFPADFANFLRTPFLQNISRRLLLTMHGALDEQCTEQCTIFMTLYGFYDHELF